MSEGNMEIAFQATPGLVHVTLGGATLSTDPISAREIAKQLVDHADQAIELLIEEMPNT